MTYRVIRLLQERRHVGVVGVAETRLVTPPTWRGGAKESVSYHCSFPASFLEPCRIVRDIISELITDAELARCYKDRVFCRLVRFTWRI